MESTYISKAGNSSAYVMSAIAQGNMNNMDDIWQLNEYYNDDSIVSNIFKTSESVTQPQVVSSSVSSVFNNDNAVYYYYINVMQNIDIYHRYPD